MERIPSRNQNEIIMKIGILTFHWATNYGAVLQCYALQEFLLRYGYEVEIINYKPSQYEETFYKFLRYRKFLHISNYIAVRKKEKALMHFRKMHLHLTPRAYTCYEVSEISKSFDLIISGSDQVANPSFLMGGEGVGIVSPTYFLGFPYDGKRIGYALSFGCVTYPEQARKVASRYIKNFNAISVREETGINIVNSMGRADAIVVPDPTLLQFPEFYHSLADECRIHMSKPYLYSFFIRHIKERKLAINRIFSDRVVLWNNEDGDYTMQGWLSKIKHSDFVVTDSFHCVVMCLKLHKPFIVVTEDKGNVGMNDRLFTLLGKLSLEQQIVHKSQLMQTDLIHSLNFQWDSIDDIMSGIREFGVTYLENIKNK